MNASLRSAVIAFSFIACLLALALPASATGCTANLTCSNSCSIFGYECPAPSCCILSCTAPSQQLSCSGTTSCSLGTNTITCDGVQHSCASQQCFNNGDFIQCGSTIKRCNSNCAC
jgi:hypothetical protein